MVLQPRWKYKLLYLQLGVLWRSLVPTMQNRIKLNLSLRKYSMGFYLQVWVKEKNYCILTVRHFNFLGINPKYLHIKFYLSGEHECACISVSWNKTPLNFYCNNPIQWILSTWDTSNPRVWSQLNVFISVWLDIWKSDLCKLSFKILSLFAWPNCVEQLMISNAIFWFHLVLISHYHLFNSSYKCGQHKVIENLFLM